MRDFGELVKLSVQPILRIIVMCSLGAIVELRGFLKQDTRQKFDKVLFTLFLPSLFFSKLSQAVTAKSIVLWWPIIVNHVMGLSLGFIVGLTLSYLLVVPRDFKRYFVFACTVGNIGNIPLVLISALAHEDPEEFGGENETLGISYVLFGTGFVSLIMFSVGLQLLKSHVPQDNKGGDNFGPALSMDLEATDPDGILITSQVEKSGRFGQGHLSSVDEVAEGGGDVEGGGPRDTSIQLGNMERTTQNGEQKSTPSGEQNHSEQTHGGVLNPSVQNQSFSGTDSSAHSSHPLTHGLTTTTPAPPSNPPLTDPPLSMRETFSQIPPTTPTTPTPNRTLTSTSSSRRFLLSIRSLSRSLSRPPPPLGGASPPSWRPPPLPPRLKSTWAYLRPLFTPPNLATFAAIIVGLIPALRDALFKTAAPLTFIGDSFDILGAAAVPLYMVSMGAALSRGPGRKQLPVRVILGGIVARLILQPAIGAGVVYATWKGGWFTAPNRVFVLVLMCMHMVPSAQNLQSLSSMLGKGEAQVVCLLFWQYLMSIVTTPVCMFLILRAIEGGEWPEDDGGGKKD